MTCVGSGFSRTVTTFSRTVMIMGFVAFGATPVLAQTAAQAAARDEQIREMRYQVIQMERTLETAVEHGATMVRERLQAALPTQLLITENAHVRGFRLDGYGIFFDIEVPSLEGSLLWGLRTLDQNDLGLQSALNEVKSYIAAKAGGDAKLEQALRRIELQVAPVQVASAPAIAPSVTGARLATGAPASTTADRQPAVTGADLVLSDPDDAFHTEIKQQIMKAMLNYSGPLEVRAEEWLTVAARRHDERPTIAPADSDARTVVIRIRGGDLAAFRAGQLSLDAAMKKMEIREF